MGELFKNLPWWAKSPAAFGGSLISAFSSHLPEALQAAGLYVGIGIAAFGIAATIWHVVRDSRRGKMLLGFVLVVGGCAIGVIGLSLIAAGGLPKTIGKPDTDKPSMFDYYRNNLSNAPFTSRQTTPTTIQFSTGEVLNIETTLYRDAAARTKFLAFYIPHSNLTYDACLGLADDYGKIMDGMTSSVVVRGVFGPNSSTVEQNELVFSGRIFIFHEDELSLQQRASLDSLYRSKGLGLQFRGTEEMMNNWFNRHPEQKKAKS